MYLYLTGLLVVRPSGSLPFHEMRNDGPNVGMNRWFGTGFVICTVGAIVNDVSAARDPGMFEVVREHGVGLVLMHMRGEPQTVQVAPTYDDVVGEVRAFLRERVEAAVFAGVAPEQLAVDPGIGFGKDLRHNLLLLRDLGALADLAPAEATPALLDLLASENLSSRRWIFRQYDHQVQANTVLLPGGAGKNHQGRPQPCTFIVADTLAGPGRVLVERVERHAVAGDEHALSLGRGEAFVPGANRHHDQVAQGGEMGRADPLGGAEREADAMHAQRIVAAQRQRIADLALLSGTLGHVLLNWAHPHAPAFVVSILLLGVPVLATAGAAVFLGEVPSLLQVVGG